MTTLTLNQLSKGYGDKVVRVKFHNIIFLPPHIVSDVEFITKEMMILKNSQFIQQGAS